MQNLRIGEVAQRLDVTTATVRNWLKIGPEYFTPGALQKTQKRFSAQDLDQLHEIQTLLQEGKRIKDLPAHLAPLPQILEAEEILGQEPAPNGAQEPEPPPAAIAPQEFFALFSNLLQDAKREMETTIAAKDDLIDELRQDKIRLQGELDQLRLPWYKRIFSQPPGKQNGS